MLQPIGNRVLVKPSEPDERSKGGLLLSTVNEEKQNSGIVVAVGNSPDVVDNFKPGDAIVFFKYGPQEVTIDEEKHLVVHFDEILGVER